MSEPKDRTEPHSKPVGRREARDYWVTAAGWAPDGPECGYSYEIGIRRKSDGAFWLIQGRWRSEALIRTVAEAVRIMLDGGITPTEIIMVFP